MRIRTPPEWLKPLAESDGREAEPRADDRPEKDWPEKERPENERPEKAELECAPLKEPAPLEWPEKLPCEAKPACPPEEAWAPPRCAKSGADANRSTNAGMRSGRCIQPLYAGFSQRIPEIGTGSKTNWYSTQNCKFLPLTASWP